MVGETQVVYTQPHRGISNLAHGVVPVGRDGGMEMVIGDEMLTPDSSRFWPLEGYEAGKGQPSYDKQFVRDWLKANPDSDYLLPDEVIEKTVDKYKDAYEVLTGKKFEA